MVGCNIVIFLVLIFCFGLLFVLVFVLVIVLLFYVLLIFFLPLLLILPQGPRESECKRIGGGYCRRGGDRGQVGESGLQGLGGGLGGGRLSRGYTWAKFNHVQGSQ